MPSEPSNPSSIATPAVEQQSSLDLDPKRWQVLFDLAKKEADDRRALELQLERWCTAHGNLEAALYSRVNDRLLIRARVGDSPFPDEIPAGPEEPAPAGEAAAGWGSLELPEGRLLYTPATAALNEGDPSLLLLAAGARISALKRQVQDHSFQAMFRGVELEVLYEVGLAIASTLDQEALGEEVLLRAVGLLDARRGALYLLEDGHYRLTSRFGGPALEQFRQDEIDLKALNQSADQGPEGWIPDSKHLMAAPVEIDDDPRGVLVIADKESRHGVGPFQTSDRRTLSLFANQAAIALENAKLHHLALEKERLEREMELAAEIQSQLLPSAMPSIPGFEVIGWNRPARQVGGDYYGFQGLGQGRWGLVVGDVTGKGMPAALLVSTLHSALRVLLEGMEIGPQLIERLNQHIYESSSSNKFITMLLAALDTEGSRLAYLNAGHNPGLMVRRDGSIEELSSAGLPLGLLPNGKYGAMSIEVDYDDLVCLYSDGITECESIDEEEFGLERLIELLREHRDQPLAQLLRIIDDAVTDFAQGQPQGDDQTVVLLRRCCQADDAP